MLVTKLVLIDIYEYANETLLVVSFPDYVWGFSK